MSAQILDFTPSNPDCLPPHNIEAEEAVLGGLLIDPDAMLRVVDLLQPEAFYLPGHGTIYRVCLELHTASEPVNLMTVASRLSDRSLLPQVGGKAKLAQLVDRTVSSVNIDALAKLIADKAVSRRMIAVGNEINRLGYDQISDLPTRLDEAEQKVFALRHQSQDVTKPESVGDISIRVYQQMEHLANTGELPAIATGFYDLDELLAGGLYPENLIILGGRPSMGKSVIGCSIAYQVAAMYQMPTLIFSLEMSKDDIVRRFLSNLAGVEGDKLRQGKISSVEWENVASATETLESIPVFIDDSPCPSVQEIKSKVRSTISGHGGLKLVVIDYLQLMVDGTDHRLSQRLGEVTRQLKLLARECKVPIMLLSQLNRGVEERSDKRPMMSDLRESGRLEEDADVILFPYRNDYYFKDSPEPGIMEIACAKHRNGATGTVKLLFDGMYSRIRNLAK